jgi:CubicO group peptidase (beta-lactamase class C family)
MVASKLNAILNSYTAQGEDTTKRLLGATYTVLSTTKPPVTVSSGRASLSPKSPPYSPQTPTWIASMTKLITAVSALQLVSSSLVTLDQDLRTVLPRLASLQLLTGFDDEGEPVLKDNDRPITLRQLLTHTSGLSYDVAEPELMRWSASKDRTANSLTWDLDGFTFPLLFPPGEGWKYGASLDWVGILIATLTNQTLNSYMKSHIFSVLGMNDSTVRLATRPDILSRRADMLLRGADDALTAIPYPTPAEHEVESGGAGLFSTPEDYSKFLAAVLSEDERILDKKAWETLFAPQLNDVQREALQEALVTAHDVYALDLPTGTVVDFSFGGLVNVEDVPGRRKKGSVMWSGMGGSQWVSGSL